MSYYTQALLAQDPHIILRCTAAAAREEIPDAAYWVQNRVWELSAQPGWDDAYAYAINTGTPDPGKSDTVVTDGMILAGVQAIRAADAPPNGPEETE